MNISNFKRMRLLLGLSQQQLADRAMVTQENIIQLEQRGIYNTKTASKYAKVLKCNPIFLLDGLDN